MGRPVLIATVASRTSCLNNTGVNLTIGAPSRRIIAFDQKCAGIALRLDQ